MEKITLVETFAISKEEENILGNAVNILADIVEFIQTEKSNNVEVQMPENLNKILDIFSANLEELSK